MCSFILSNRTICHHSEISLVGGGQRNHRDIAERREAQRFSKSYLASIKALVVLRGCSENNVAFGIVRLDYRLAGNISATGTTYHLRQHSECSLPCSIVVESERVVRAEHSYSSDTREVMPLCHHLSSEKHVCLSASEFV